jgi:hypothetical protein
LGLQTLMIGAGPLCSLIFGGLGHTLGTLAAVRARALAGSLSVVALALHVPQLHPRLAPS